MFRIQIKRLYEYVSTRLSLSILPYKNTNDKFKQYWREEFHVNKEIQKNTKCDLMLQSYPAFEI